MLESLTKKIDPEVKAASRQASTDGTEESALNNPDSKANKETEAPEMNIDPKVLISGVELDQKPMSKSAMKKRKRHEKLMEIKKRKKQQAKERKAAKAKAEGRDLDEERRIQAERRKSGEGRRKREERWAKRMESANESFQVCIDCGFEDLMTYKEKNSLASQIRYCYATNKRSDNPVYLSVPSLVESGVTHEQLSKVEGFPELWKPRAFACSAEPVEKMHDPSKLVYLTSDSEHTLEHLDDSKVYIIGGIVDRNRLKRTTIEKATKLGIATAKLPIEDHLKLCATKVLTVNHVFEILLKYRQHGNNWKKALLDVLPQRKDITEVNTSQKDTKDNEAGEKKQKSPK